MSTLTEMQQDHADEQATTDCKWCRGRGWNSSANGKALCTDCEGTGRVKVEEDGA